MDRSARSRRQILRGSAAVSAAAALTVAVADRQSALSAPAPTTTSTTTTQSSGLMINVKDYGATGDGTTDDTAAIQNAINAGSGRMILVPAGTYVVRGTYASTSIGTTALILNSPGTRLLLDGGAQLAMSNSGTNSSASIVSVTAADCAVYGGTLKGDLRTHTGTSGEWSYGLSILPGADRFVAQDVRSIECWGDGFNITALASQSAPADVQLLNCVADSNRRQGASVEAGIRPRIVGGAFVNTGKIKATSPSAGIDVEPNPNQASVTDFLISSVTCSGNVGSGILLSANTGTKCTGLVTGCQTTSNGRYGIEGVRADKADPLDVRVLDGRYVANTLGDYSLSTASGASGWHAWTPVVQASVTNPSGLVTKGSYSRGENGVVVATFEVTFASGFNPGNGQYSISLPVGVDPDLIPYDMTLPGWAHAVIATTGNHEIYSPAYFGSSLIRLFRSGNYGALGSRGRDDYEAWTTGSYIRGTVTFPAQSGSTLA